jgi:hypothetical protein
LYISPVYFVSPVGLQSQLSFSIGISDALTGILLSSMGRTCTQCHILNFTFWGTKLLVGSKFHNAYKLKFHSNVKTLFSMARVTTHLIYSLCTAVSLKCFYSSKFSQNDTA